MPEKASPLLEKNQTEVTERPKYSEEEETYIGNLKLAMEKARDMRDQEHEEFDGMDYITYYQTNERLANTFIQPKRNKEDSNFQSGVIRQKLFALLASVTSLNLAGDISAYDKEDLKIQSLGNAMEDIILKTNELDVDDEKKFLRHYELLKHGTVFVEELWDDKKKKEKKLSKKFNGKVSDAQWTTKLKKAFARPTRNIIPGINLYMGDISIYNITDQPRIFSVDIIPYQQGKAMFGDWERWDNVPKKLVRTDDKASNITKDWTLTQVDDNFIEIIRYQDKWNNEFALMLNGVLMTPVGLPLPWGYEEYNIAQQNLEPIHSKFAYGKSLVFRLRNKVALLDEMLKLAVLKTQKSFVPPKFNLTGRVVSNRTFMPGKINYGIDPRLIFNADDKEVQGVTQAELAMINHIKETIDLDNTPQMPSGSNHAGKPNVNEILEFQRQAKQLTGLIVFSVTMLEWKLEWLRLKNIIANWFQEQDQVVDEVRGMLKDKYRSVGVDRPIPGEGMGRRIVVPTKQIPSGKAIMQAEQSLTQEQGVPVRLIFIDPDQVCAANLVWQIVTRPVEKKTSETQKLLFRAFMQDAQIFGPMLNMEGMAEEFASVWEKDPNKIFKSQDQQQIEQMQAAQAGQVGPDGKPLAPETPAPGGGSAGGGLPNMSPKVAMPTPKMGQQ